MHESLREHIEKIIPLSDDQFDLIRQLFIPRKFKKHQYLVQEGDPVYYSYFVVSGLLKLAHTGEDNKEHILHFAMEDWWVSDYQAFFSKSAATMSLDCLEDAEVLCITLENHEKLCSAVPRIEHFFLKKAYNGYFASQQRILSLLSNNAKERYELMLNLYPSLMQRVNKTLIASYLGVSRETLSRLSS